MNSDLTYKNLLQQAEEARNSAYCPYSEFAVGAALLTESGEVYTGANIENASYPLCLCAERVAFGKAISDGHRKFKAIAIVGAKQNETPDFPCPPCGACRQVMSEFCECDFHIILSDDIYLLKDLLPVRFKLNSGDNKID